MARFPSTRVAVQPQSTIVLYTDGLIERRDEILDAGIERLVQNLSVADSDDADAVADALVGSQRDWRGHDDDVAVLIAAFDAPRLELKLGLSSGPQSLQRLRHTLQRWLAAHAVDPGDAYDILFAANEAAANVVKHAYGLRRGPLDVELRARNGRVDVVVADRGQWRPRRSDAGGRGLELMRAVMDEVRVEQGSRGSVVSMSKRIRRRPT